MAASRFFLACTFFSRKNSSRSSSSSSPCHRQSILSELAQLRLQRLWGKACLTSCSQLVRPKEGLIRSMPEQIDAEQQSPLKEHS